MFNGNKNGLSEAFSPFSRDVFIYFGTYICRNLCCYQKLSSDACVEGISDFLEKLELRCSGAFCEASGLPCGAGKCWPLVSQESESCSPGSDWGPG